MSDAHDSRRRELLRYGLSTLAAAWAPAGLVRADTLLAPTPALTAGPFYPLRKPADRDGDLTRLAGREQRAQGQILMLEGRVVNVRGEPISGARVELWQANANGRYAHDADPSPAPLDPNFQGYGEQVTQSDGRFRFITVKPGPYATAGGGMRTPHIHFTIQGVVDRRTTQLFFKGEPLNDQDRIFQQIPANRANVVAELLPAATAADSSARLVRWTVVLPRG